MGVLTAGDLTFGSQAKAQLAACKTLGIEYTQPYRMLVYLTKKDEQGSERAIKRVSVLGVIT